MGIWHNSGPLNMPAGLKVSRPDIVFDRADTVIICWATDHGFYCHVANASDKWKDTKLLRMTGPEFTSNDACKHDRRLLMDKGILSFTAYHKGGTKDKGYAIVDFDINKFRQHFIPWDCHHGLSFA